MENASVHKNPICSMPELVAHLLGQMPSEVVGRARVSVCIGGPLLDAFAARPTSTGSLEAHIRAVREYWRIEYWYSLSPVVDNTILCAVGIKALCPLRSLMEP